MANKETISNKQALSNKQSLSNNQTAPNKRRITLKKAVQSLPLIVILGFLIAPLVVLAVSSFNADNSLGFPPKNFSLRWYQQVLENDMWRESMVTSLLLVLLVVPTVVVIATLGGYGVAAGRFKSRGFFQMLFLSPLLIPEVMLGLGMLLLFQSLGLLNTLTSMWLAHTLVALPFAVRSVMVSVAALDTNLIRASSSLGASQLRTFWNVTLPGIRPGIISGGVFAGVVSLGEVAVSAFVSGTETTTVPLRILSAVQFQLDPSAAAVSTIMLLICVVLIIVLEKYTKISRVL